MKYSENILVSRAVDILRERLPTGWTVGVALSEPSTPVDALVQIRAPDGREVALLAQVKEPLHPQGALTLLAQMKALADSRPALVVAPWISRSTREILVAEGINLIDLTGAVRLALADPGLFIDTPGADRDPWPQTLHVTLRGSKAARVVRALSGARLPLGVRELASRAGTTPGYVSKLLRLLDDQAAVRRTQAGQISGVDLRRLLQQWANDAPLSARAKTSSWIAPRGLTTMQDRLRKLDLRYAVTASLVASRLAPVAAPRVISIYVDDPERFAEAVELRAADAGANVLLLVPDDEYPFTDTWTDNGLRFAALPQVVVDLLSGPGRGPAEAEALLGWMSEHPEVWHG